MSRSRRVLVITNYFPPGGGVGVQRVLNIVKHLEEHDWQPLVLCNAHPHAIPHDPTLLAALPADLAVRRIPPLIAFPACARLGRKRTSAPPSTLPLRLLCFLLVPDPFIGWVRPAVRAALRWCREEEIDLILTTSPPHSTHFVGRIVNRRLGLPWVADFRDAWSTDPDRHLSLHNRLRISLLEKRQERRVVEAADRIVSVTDVHRDDFLVRFPALAREDVRVVMNGYAPGEFDGLEPLRSDPEGFVVTYTGTMDTLRRSPLPLIRALARLRSREPAIAGAVRLVLVGEYPPALPAAVTELGLEEAVTFTGRVSHREALGYQLGSDVNVVIYNGPADRRSAQIMSGKIFEYIGAGRPVLVLAPPEAGVSRLVRENGLGAVADPGDPDRVAGALMALRGGEIPAASQERSTAFAWRNRVAEFAALFDTLVPVPGEPS